MAVRLGKPFVIENRPNVMVINPAVARSAPDGHTLLMVTPANSINAW
jgi:hypothetical protein